jgi:hypothetical protein
MVQKAAKKDSPQVEPGAVSTGQSAALIVSETTPATLQARMARFELIRESLAALDKIVMADSEDSGGSGTRASKRPTLPQG